MGWIGFAIEVNVEFNGKLVIYKTHAYTDHSWGMLFVIAVLFIFVDFAFLVSLVLTIFS